MPIVVQSFGTLDLPPGPILPAAWRTALPYGVDLAGHRSRVLGEGDLEHVDLAIGFEPSHVAAAVVTGSIAKARAFLLTELTTLLRQLPELDTAGLAPEELIRLANAARPLPRSPSAVGDPAGRGDREFMSTFARIEEHVAFIGRVLEQSMSESAQISLRDPSGPRESSGAGS